MRNRILFMLCFLFVGISAFAQVSISGKVIDNTGFELPGVNVVVKGTTVGTMTLGDGTYTLQDVPGGAKAVLEFSYIGFKPVEVVVGNQKVIDVTMTEDSEQLEEVVVVAYGTAKKKDLTGAMTAIDSKVVSTQSNSSVSRALEGAAPGIQVASIDGQPGVDMGIRVRGSSSASQNSSSALVVIDGVPVQSDSYTTNALASLNPKDIESMTVLKDAASTALYGSRGANGVILITTKKGKKGKTQINFQGRWGVNQQGPFSYEKISDPQDVYEYAWQAIYNDVRYDRDYKTNTITENMSHDQAALFASQHLFDYAGSTTNFQRNSLGNYMVYDVPGLKDGLVSTGSGSTASSTMNGTYLVNTDGKLNPNARLLYDDTYDDRFLENRFRQEYNVSASGGSEKVSYFASLGYLEDPSYIRGSEFQRYNGRANVDAQLFDWLKVGSNMAYTYRKTQSPATRYGRNPGSAVANVFRWTNGQNQLIPYYAHNEDGSILMIDGVPVVNSGAGLNYSPFGPTGSPTSSADLAAILDKDKDLVTGNDFNMRTYAEASFLKYFKLTVNMSIDKYFSDRTRYWNKDTGQATSTNGAYGKEKREVSIFNTQQLLNYNREIGKHSISAMVGHEFNEYNYNNINYNSAYSLISDFDAPVNFVGHYTGGTFSSPGVGKDKTAMESYLFRGSYVYDNKYYGEASLRRDGSSKFKYAEDRWGTFWSIGGGWRISAEEFMKPTENWLNNLKVRASYGVIGNQSGISNHSGYQTWSYSANYTQTTSGNGIPASYKLSKNTYVPDNLTWENTNTFDAGIDFTLFNRVNGTFDFYNKLTTNTVWNQPIAYSLGQSTIQANNAKLRNRGVELDLNIDLIKTEDLYRSFGVNGTHYKTILVEVPEGVGTAELDGNFTAGVDSWSAIGGASTSSITYLRGEGKDFYNLYFFKYGGVDQTTGLPLFYHRVTAAEVEAGTYPGYKAGESFTTTNYEIASRYELGSAVPKFIGGFNTNLRWRDFDFTAMFAFQLGGKFLSVEYANSLYRSENYGSALSSELIGNTWTPNNTNAKFPMAEAYSTYANGATIGSWAYTDMALFNASYLNVKNITLGYTLPKQWTSKAGVSSMRVFFTADNVFMFTGHAGFDPRMSLVGGLEVGAYAYPSMRTISVGVDLNF